MNQVLISVAVGILFNSRRDVLLAWRDEKKKPGNCWEFPGGKIEKSENPKQALCRELYEEIGIEIEAADPLFIFAYDYENCRVILHTWCVNKYQNLPQGKEGQMLAWVAVPQLRYFKLPAANYTIVDFLQSSKTALIAG